MATSAKPENYTTLTDVTEGPKNPRSEPKFIGNYSLFALNLWLLAGG